MVYNFEVQDYHTYFVGSTIWVHNSCGNFAKGATQGTKSNYRKLFLNKFPDLPKGWQVHHTLPQKYADIIKKMGINVHEVKYLKGVDPDVHKLITKEWRNWDKGKIDVSEYYAIKVAIEKPSYDDPQIGYAIPGKKLFDWLSRNAGSLLLYTAGTAVEVAGWVADLGTITLLFGSVPSGGSSLALAPVTVSISSTAKVTGAAMMGTALYMMRQNSGGNSESSGGQNLEGITPPKNRKGLRNAMKKSGGPPEGMKNPQAHHGLPWKYKDWFAKRSLNVNNSEFGAWVRGGGNGGHQSWSRAYDQVWKNFTRQNNKATADDIINFFNQIRKNSLWDGGF